MIYKEDVINTVTGIGVLNGFTFLKKDIEIEEFSTDKFEFVDSVIFKVKFRRYKWIAPILSYEKGLGNNETLYLEVNGVWIIVSEY